MEEENKQKEEQQQTAVTTPPSQVLVIQPQYSGEIQITVNTQIQTNRRTNFYLVADWPAQLLQKKMPIFYYPPINETIYEQCSKINTPTSLWLSEMGHFYYGTSSYLEVQFWMNNQEGMKQLIPKCRTHSTLIKLPGQPYEEKAISHEEVKWKRNTMVFGVNFNCTRSCFKSEVYMFVRARLGHLFWESSLIELPFRRSEKRKQDQVGLSTFSSTSKKHLLQAPEFSAPIISQPSENSLLNQMLQKTSSEEQIDLQRRIFAHLQIMAASQRAQINNAAIQDLWSPSQSQSNIFTNSTLCNPTEIQWFPDTEDIM